MNEWFEYLTCNIIMRMLAGERFSASTCNNSDTEEGHLKEAIRKALYLSGIVVVLDAIPWLEWVDIGGHVKAMKQTYKEIDAVLGRWLEEHVQKSTEISDNINGGEADFIDVMLSVLAEDTPMFGHKRDTVIKATTMILILTWLESTAETLTWALSPLLNNKHVLKAAQDELETQVGRDKLVQESNIKNLKYLQAIVMETLCLYPSGLYRDLRGHRRLHRQQLPRPKGNPFDHEPVEVAEGPADVARVRRVQTGEAFERAC